MTDNEDILIRQKRMDDANLREDSKGPPWRMWPDLKEGKLEKTLREKRAQVSFSPGRDRTVIIKSRNKRRILTPLTYNPDTGKLVSQ
jgi:hypothetical protein